MAHDTLYAIGEALIDMIPSKTGCSFAEVPSFSFIVVNYSRP